MKNVVIYVKKGCPYCKIAKDLLDKKGVKYEEIDVLKNSDAFSHVKLTYKVKTVPQIFITDENGKYISHIAGSDKLIELEEAGKLDSMLSNVDTHTDTEINLPHDIGFVEYSTSNDDLM
ncbi:glutaredoxin domain-containing protein [Wolbachia endosymbiont of Pentidionis agamae]|uniref:glutaredoxin domain-containing protein n=1 Tax=Wolbachia endosymbiont of Pentidionis agamae TaxID=3110435 RepID=UPI002FD010F5